MVVVVGFALLGLMVTPVRKQVFLLVITVITNVMHCMTTAAITVQKSGSRPFKKSAFGGEKIAACGMHLFNSPKGRECQPDVVHILDVWGGWSMSLVVFRTCIDALYTLLYMCLSAWVGESMVCPCKVQVVKDIVEDILLWGLSCLGMSGS